MWRKQCHTYRTCLMKTIVLKVSWDLRQVARQKNLNPYDSVEGGEGVKRVGIVVRRDGENELGRFTGRAQRTIRQWTDKLFVKYQEVCLAWPTDRPIERPTDRPTDRVRTWRPGLLTDSILRHAVLYARQVLLCVLYAAAVYTVPSVVSRCQCHKPQTCLLYASSSSPTKSPHKPCTGYLPPTIETDALPH